MLLASTVQQTERAVLGDTIGQLPLSYVSNRFSNCSLELFRFLIVNYRAIVQNETFCID